MSNTQLPADILEVIEMKAEHEAALHFHPTHSPDQNTACRICYRNGAKEYATELHQARQATEEKIDKALHAERNKMQKRVSESHQAQQDTKKAKQLLFRLASLVNVGQSPDDIFLTEIKTFLDGTK